MNFLGHLYFSDNHLQLMHANLFGDFVKGRDLSNYSQLTQKGIRLHRQIDNYIDHHPDVLELMHGLYQDLPKVTGIAIDLFFDHLLASNWKCYHDKNYESFIQDFYNTEIDNREDYSTEYLIMIAKMREYNWLHYYQFQDGLIKACNGLSKRISFASDLNKAPAIFLERKSEINLCFEKYMQDAKTYFETYFNEHIRV